MSLCTSSSRLIPISPPNPLLLIAHSASASWCLFDLYQCGIGDREICYEHETPLQVLSGCSIADSGFCQLGGLSFPLIEKSHSSPRDCDEESA